MLEKLYTTVGNGSLGSRVDEERSELRKVMRFATIVNHRILERTLHPLGHSEGSAWVSIDYITITSSLLVDLGCTLLPCLIAGAVLALNAFWLFGCHNMGYGNGR